MPPVRFTCRKEVQDERFYHPKDANLALITFFYSGVSL
ncbi:MAG: hypothetical protein RLZZ385_1166 [Pseudomonadota bacterium]|jgi:hypothetical protein